MRVTLAAGFLARFSIAYAVVIGAVVSKEAFARRSVESYKGLRGSVLLLGILLGALVLGRLSDIRGRKPSLLIGTIIRTIGTIATPYSPSYYVALVARFVAGFGIGGVMASAPAYVLEASSGRDVVLMESMRARGSAASALAALRLPGRQEAFVLGSILGLASLVLGILAPEPEYRPARRPISELIRGFARLAVPLRIARMIVGFAYYYRLYTIREVLAELGSAAESAYKKIFVSLLSQLIGYAYAYALYERLGGKKIIAASFVLGSLALTLYFANATLAGIAFIAFNVGVRGAIYAYTPEAFPEGLRSTALGAGVAMARIGAFLGPIAGYAALSGGLRLRVTALAFVHALGALAIFFASSR